jgi:hypothetical protein
MEIPEEFQMAYLLLFRLPSLSKEARKCQARLLIENYRPGS